MSYTDAELMLDRQTVIRLAENKEYYRCGLYADVLKRCDYPSGSCSFSFNATVVWDDGAELVKLTGAYMLTIKPCGDLKLPNQSPYQNGHIDVDRILSF